MDTVKVMVLGATGTAGRSALPRLVAAGHDVTAHARTSHGAAAIRAAGAEPFHADTDDMWELRRMMRGRDAVVDLRVAVPGLSRAARPQAWREYARLRGPATGLLVDTALRAGVPRLVRDTVTMVYADGGDRDLEEDSPVEASGALAGSLEAERHLARFTAAGGTGVVLRFGGFYGPDDEFSRELMSAARRGWVPVFGDPLGWTSAVHTDDVGAALLHALAVPAGVYNVVDDEPLLRVTLYSLLARAAGVPHVRPLPNWLSRVSSAPLRALARSHRVSSRRFRELGWRPVVSSRRSGWPAAFAADQERPGWASAGHNEAARSA